jgi:hypothetical protein
MFQQEHISYPPPSFFYCNTQFVGNLNSLPTIKAATGFVGLGMLTTDVYLGTNGDNEWYIEQSNFYRQVRNFNIDVTAATVTYLEDYLSYSGHTSIMSNHSSAKPVTILAQSLTVGKSRCSPLSSVVCRFEGRGEGRR